MAVAFPFALDHVADAAFAQSQDLGSMTVSGGAKPAPRKKVKQTSAPRANATRQAAQTAAPAVVPLTSDAAIGSGAPAGSAPALAPSQGSLNSFQPTSIVSDKIIKDVVKSGGDYNETAKFTPGFISNNPNGIGDSKSGWRGFQDGQFNITFDGIPFGDANDPTHHSAAYFPASFLSRVTVDRGPGAASQFGYATFGGTLGLNSLELSDKAGASMQASVGNHSTFTTSLVGQSGYYAPTGTRALVSVSTIRSDGQLQYGDSQLYQGLLKVEKQMGEVKVTALATGGTEHYTNVNSITWPQYLAYGVNYGQVNANPKTQQFHGFNNSLKATDMEYIRAEWDLGGWKFDNTIYTQSYWYPRNQRNGADQGVEPTVGGTLSANAGTLSSIKWPASGYPGSATYSYSAVPAGDVTGYDKVNSLRAYGDIFKVSKDLNTPLFTGTLRAGLWLERVGNERVQHYIDYTTGAPYEQINTANPLSAAYKTNLHSYMTNVQPFMEYEWRINNNLTLTPGYKFVSFTRDHQAMVNGTTLMPFNYKHTYTANLPFLTARYKVSDELTVYAQGSKGFLAPPVAAYYVVNTETTDKVEPQRTTNYQMGAVYKTKDWTIAADVYRVTAENFPVFTTTLGVTSYENSGTARYQGLEVEGTYALMNGFAAYASGALINAKYVQGPNTGLKVGAAPSYTLAGGLIYDDQTYFASLLHKVVGDQYGADGQKAASVTGATLNKIGSYNSTDLVAGVRSDVLKRIGFGEKAEFKLGVSNIFDHRNITDISGKVSGLTSINNTTLSYAFMSGRTFYAAVKVDF